MWIATSETSCVRLEAMRDDGAFMASNLRVMQGEATLEADKKSLVLPILGLYAELYACVLVARQVHAPRTDRLRAEHIAGRLRAARLVPRRG
jgi:hypothetical protein